MKVKMILMIDNLLKKRLEQELLIHMLHKTEQ